MRSSFEIVAQAIRILLRSPGYALTCIGVLALGIGANAAIFTVVYSVILKPLPFPDAARLVFVWQRFPALPDPPFGRVPVPRKNYEELKRQNTVFSDVAAFRSSELQETGVEHPRPVSTGFASANLFEMLGAKPRIGRLFASTDERKDYDHVAVVTDSYFERRFNHDPAALGKSLTLGGVSYSIIGVLPPKFHLPATQGGSNQVKPDLWVPLSRSWNKPDDDNQRQLFVAARLKNGVSLAQARTEVAGLAQRLAQADPNLNEGWTATVFPFQVEDTSPTLHRALYVLLGTVGFLLLIACANLANLTLARASRRSREIAIRLALGATRARVFAQLVAESFVVSVAGAAVGLGFAYWCIQLMLALKPPDIQRPELITINLPVFAFAALLSILTTLLFGLVPSIAASGADLNTTLKAGGGWGGSAARLRSRQFLIAVEVALALVLVAGAGLMLRSFQELVATGIGFDTQQLVTADVDLPEKHFPDGVSESRFYRNLLARVRSIPGVSAATLVDNLPLHRVTASSFYIAGRPEPPIQSLPIADNAHVSPEYFSVIGLRLLSGRNFTDADLTVAEKDQDNVAIVNQTFARQFFHDENPIGQRLLDSDKKYASQIIGVVSDYRPMGIEGGSHPQIFWPYLKMRSATLIARAGGSPAVLGKALQSTIWSLDKDIPANIVRPMGEYVDQWQSQRKFNTLLLGIFAALALALAMIGIYGVLSNLVASRIREIGIRMAIGAAPLQIGKLIFRQGMLPVFIGAAAGVAGGLMLGRLLESLLFQVRPYDPLTLALSVAAILVFSPIALFVPLRRATKVDCTTALHEE